MSQILKGAHQGHPVDHRGKHPHVVRGCTIHSTMTRSETAPDIPPPDDDGNLDPHLADLSDGGGHFLHNLGGDAV